MAELLAKLREACHDMHEALHVHPLLMPLNTDVISQQDYHWAIAAFKTAYQQPEKHNFTLSLPSSPVMKWLEQDSKNHTISLPVLPELQPLTLNTISHEAGYLYVKQGSTLGGQVISKHLTRSLNLRPGVDNIFFHGYGSDTGKKWRDFLYGLGEIESKLNEQEVIAAAQMTFKRIALYCDEILKIKHD